MRGGVCVVARHARGSHHGLRRAPCIRSPRTTQWRGPSPTASHGHTALPTRLTRNTQTGSRVASGAYQPVEGRRALTIGEHPGRQGPGIDADMIREYGFEDAAQIQSRPNVPAVEQCFARETRPICDHAAAVYRTAGEKCALANHPCCGAADMERRRVVRGAGDVLCAARRYSKARPVLGCMMSTRRVWGRSLLVVTLE